MALVKWDPWSEVARLRRELDGFLGDRSAEWRPAADVTRDDDSITVKVDLPGLGADDVKVELREQSLVITGERKQESEQKYEGTIVRERVFGSFIRTLSLPAGVEAEDVQATFANGELTVTVTLPAQPETKEIEVKSLDQAAV